MIKLENLKLDVVNNDELRNMTTEQKRAWAIAYNEEQARLRANMQLVEEEDK